MLCDAVAVLNWLEEVLKRVVVEVIDGDREVLLVIVCVSVVEPVAEVVDELVSVEICDAD